MRGSIESVFNDPSGANWAPWNDGGNNPDSYLSTMLANMNRLADIDDQWIAATVAPSPPILAKWLPGSHTKGRGGARALGVVLHITAGASAGSAWNWWLHIADSANPSSAHYIVDRDSLGSIWCCVREADTSWANGILASANLDKALVRRWVSGGINPNRETISVEVAGYSPQQPNTNPALNGYTEAQWRALEFLLPSIAARWALAIDAEAVLGHKDIDGVNRANCPGLNAEEWQRVYAMDESSPATPDQAYDEWCAAHDDTVVWAGEITGRGHWNNLDPQPLARTAGNVILAWTGTVARDVTGYAEDDWESQCIAAGQLRIFGM
jgi:N-acetyl-anhydromuramyl-L-alanine amidase AmpD